MDKVFPAELDKFTDVQEFVDAELEKVDCPMKIVFAMDVAIEEIFVNIAHYAYGDKKGNAVISVNAGEHRAEITFTDEGIPFDPLKHTDPDTTLDAEDRPIGGLGILMVKKSMDQVSYVYEDGKNKFTMVKTW